MLSDPTIQGLSLTLEIMNNMPRRYQLTPEDRYKGALATNKLHEAHGWAQQRRASAASRGKTHVFTPEERRRAGLATAEKRRAERLAAIYLGGPEKTFAEVAKMEAAPTTPVELYPDHEEHDPSLLGPVTDIRPVEILPFGEALRLGMERIERETATRVFAELKSDSPAPTLEEVERMRDDFNATEVGKALATKLLAGEGADCTRIAFPSAQEHAAFHAPDPFTLSALKRFRLGPLSPLSLTRSQRAHVQVMRDTGYLEADGENMVRLTEKGRQAIEEERV